MKNKQNDLKELDVKIDGFLISLDCKMKHLLLFDYGLLDKICEKINYLISEKVVLQIV